RADRASARALSRHRRAGSRRRIAPELVCPAVRQDRRPAGDTGDRLEPLPGEDPHRQHADVLSRLERGLPGPRELHVSPLRAQRQPGWREQGPLRGPRIRPALRRDEEHGERPEAPGDHRPHGEDRARRGALGLGLPPQGLRAVSHLGQPDEAEQDGAQYAQVRSHRPGAARAQARGMEPSRGVAARTDRPGARAAVHARLRDLSPPGAASGQAGRPHALGRGRVIAYILRRTLYAIPILIGVNLLTFLLFFVVNTPDDMARIQLGVRRVTTEAVEKWKAEHGYNKPRFYDETAQGLGRVTNTIFYEKSLKLFVFDFGNAD